MPRYKLLIEYDGTPFSGWQIQDNAPTVQGAMEAAVKAICGEQVRVHGSGRTDAGVHALGQVAHCDIEKPFPPGRLRDGLNAHLRPHPIGVLSAEIVADDFEARFSARKRHYRYRITNTRANLALDIKRSWRVPRHLDTDAMDAAAKRLLGKHDFTTFRDTECQAKSPEKTLGQLDVIRDGDAHFRALVPAQPGALDGGLAGLGRRRPLERRRPRRRARRPQPRRLRPRGAARGTVSGAGGVLGCAKHQVRGVRRRDVIGQLVAQAR
jgi:tRNA pseudouridine38-40 synthase